ncbi:MAG: archease [Thermodesulfovibrio sp.]|nr:archease [Thermodesulfovibrio sp.]MDW7998708.1 archease [Thermodesulfovibrio sp.]
MSYRVIDVPGDVGIRAEGKTIEECFISAAMGLYSLITDLENIESIDEREIELIEESLENLLISFLNELIFHFDTYGFVGKEISLSIKENKLLAKIKGENFNPEKHEKKLLVKAATYHGLTLKRENSLWIAEIIFDI